MKKYLLPLLLVTIVLFVSCRKKEIPANPIEKTEITFGSIEGMKRIPHSGDSVSIDGDAKPEIKLITEQIKIRGPVFVWKLSLRAVSENITFLGSFRNDTTFMYRDTSIYKDNYTYRTFARIESCERKRGSDSVLSVRLRHFRLSYQQNGSKARMDSHFGNDENVVFDEPYSNDDSRNVSPDTIEVHSQVFLRDCNGLRPEGISYIGFKYSEGAQTKLGWIKLKADKRVHVIEEVVMAE